jgi:hypothetical protein
MQNSTDRFECLRQTTDHWIVWDKFASRSATLGGSMLTGLSSERASIACEILTRIYRHGLDVDSIRSQDKPTKTRRRDPDAAVDAQWLAGYSFTVATLSS